MLSHNKTALVTGGSSGIGAAIAQKFSSGGYDVLILGRDVNKLQSVQKKCVGKTEILSLDLKDFASKSQRITEKLHLLSPLDVLVNNAGVFHFQNFSETSSDIWAEQFQVNLLSAVQLTQLIWPLFKKQKRGSILNISSTLGIKPVPGTSAYSAMKAAMINWTLNLAQEGGTDQIRANCICPGLIDTPIHAFHSLPEPEKTKATSSILENQLLKTLGQPEDIAEAAYFLSSDQSRWTTGAVLHIDGGINIK